MRLLNLVVLVVSPLLGGCAGCGHVPPPKSMVPTGEAAVEQLRKSAACGHALQATAAIDYFGDKGRVRAELMMIVERPASLRMDLTAQVVGTLATLTSDSRRFALMDLRNKEFLFGPPSACNIARLTQVTIPGPALVDLLRGQAPILKHVPGTVSMRWDAHGYYVVTVPSTRQASEVLQIGIHPSDLDKPWETQRLRLLDVSVVQQGYTLYHAELEAHAPGPMWKDHVEPEDALEGKIALSPSGPACTADLPRKIHVEMPVTGDDVLFRYDDVAWNPAIREGIFQQLPPPGIPVGYVSCPEP